MTIVEEYLSYTNKYKSEYGEKTIVLMQVGSFFEVYALKNEKGEIIGSNIEDFSCINDMIIAEKSRMTVGKSKVLMAGFGVNQLDKYVKKLQQNGYTIVVYVQDIQGKNTTRSLSEIISPGTYFCQDNVEISNNIMSIWIEKSELNKVLKSQITIGISNIDIYTGKCSVYQYNKDYYHNPSTYDELERYISINNPNECLIISNLESEKISDIIEFTNINSKTHIISLNGETDNEITKLAKNAEKQTYQHAVMQKFYPKVDEENLFDTLTCNYISVQAFTMLLDFVYKHSPQLVDKLKPPIYENHSDKLILANHTLKQLNILDDNRYSGKYRSVGTLLNECVTTMGKRKFSYSINNPRTDVKKLSKSYDITEHILNNNKIEEYREILKKIHDMEKLQRKLILKKTTPKDFAILADDLNNIKKLYSITKKDEKINKYIKLDNIDKNIKTILDELNQTFNLNKCYNIDDISIDKLNNLSNDNLNFIKDGVSPRIDKLVKDCLESKNKLDAICDNLSLLVESQEKNKGQKYIKIHETPKSQPLLIGTKRRVSLLTHIIEKRQNKELNIKYKDINGNDTCFKLDIEKLSCNSIGSNKKDLIVTNNEINKLSSSIQTSQERLANEIILFYEKYIIDFTENNKLLEDIILYTTTMDELQCKAYIALKYNYCKPNIIKSEKSFVSFDEIRHPLIEHIQNKEIYVTNDLDLGKNKDGILLYGTNAVGKTSFIKSVGIAVIMAQAGLYVPCSRFDYNPYTCIFTRILGNDNIFKGLSTFAVEMSELRTILNYADKNSLILGDELCSGTESDSALSIFTTGLEILHKKKSTFLFATHFHEIVEYDEIKSMTRLGMKHMEVIYDKTNNVLVYDRKIKDGPGESMYGLEVCKSLNLSNEFLERAHSIRTKYNKRYMNTLNEKSSRYNSKKIKGMCEICKKERASEVHHLQHQKNANTTNSYISSFHKNHLANLLNVCDECHDKLHNKKNEHKVQKTSNGYILSIV